MTRRRIRLAVLITVVVAAFVGSAVGTRLIGEDPARGAGVGRAAGPQRVAPARRIVSLAPSVTEVLFGVGCGDRLVGRTQYCNYPAAARRVPSVGGYVDPNLEVVTGLRPDLVIATRMGAQGKLQRALRRMGIRVLIVDHGHLEGVIASFRSIGRACGGTHKAEALVAATRARIAAVQRRIRGRPRRSALVVFGRNGTPGALREVYVAGRTGLYEEIIHLAGGRNAYTQRVPAFPKLSLEGVLRIDPDAIIELASDQLRHGHTVAELRQGWLAVPQLSAVKHGRLRFVTGGYGQIPGPRLFRLVEDVARALHPEVHWGPQ